MKNQHFPGKLLNWFGKPGAFVLLLGLVMISAYGLHICSLGFYWDDWEDIFLYTIDSPIEYVTFFIFDRPTTAWMYLFTFPLLKTDPLLWQIFNILLRYGANLGIWWVFWQAWPKRRFEISWLILLVAVYPGFSQQVIAVAYSRQFLALLLFSISLILSVFSIRYPRWYGFLTFLSVFLSFLQMMTMEYFVGLEVFRPVIFWQLLRERYRDDKHYFLRVFQWWFPYVIPLVGFLYWRLFVLKPVPNAAESNTLISFFESETGPITQLIHLAQNIIQDTVHELVFIWTKTIRSNTMSFTSTLLWGSLFLGGIVAGICGASVFKYPDEDSRDTQFGLAWIGIGLVAVLAGGIPVWITDRQIIVGLWSDRFALGPMLSITMISVAIITVLGYKRLQKTIIFSLMLAIAIAYQYRTIETYRMNWDIQRNYYWQFFWRVPAMQPGTAIFGTKMPFGYNSEYSISFAYNSIYAPDITVDNIPYWFFSSMRAYGNNIPDFLPDLPVSYSFRSIKFLGSTSNGIVTNYKTGDACVGILKPSDRYSPLLTSDEIKLAQLSNLDMIMRESKDPRISPEDIFGPEPEHGWCYFYQKADLARQFEEWDDVVALGDEAFGKGLSPAVGTEYEPFIEGYANAGQWETAFSLTERAAELTNNMEGSLCSVWRRLETIGVGNTSASEEWKNKVYSQYQCELFFNQSP